MALIIYSSPLNKNGLKSMIAAEYNGVKIEYVSDFQMGVTNKTPEYLKLNPMGKVPLLLTPDGPIFESNAMARYVCRLNECTLLGTSVYEQALIDQWVDFATTEIDPYMLAWYAPILGFRPFVPELHELAVTSLKRAFTALNTALASKTFLVGDSVTFADIVVTCNLSSGFRMCLTKEFTSEFPHVERYFWTLINQPEFCKHYPDFKQVDKVAAPKSPQKTRELPAAPVEKKSGKTKKTEPKEEKVAPPPAEKPAPQIDEEDEKPKPKPKNPLDLLPPSPMIMDEWKRLYSNTKAHNFREVAIKGFWDMYDSEGYSLWFCDYKYNEENTVTFVTMNKVGGFLQRMDFIRKHAFAKMCILGESAPFKIKGVWLFRGSEIPQMVLDECYDVELYEWTKVDISDEAQKERVSAYFEEPDVIDGEKLLEAKCFK